MPEYDHWQFKRDEPTLVSLREIDDKRKNTVENIERYIKNANDYLFDLARHRQFVERNIDYDRAITFEQRLAVPFGFRMSDAHNYVITITSVPVKFDELLPSSAACERTINQIKFSSRKAKLAVECFLENIAVFEPRFITLFDVPIDKLAYYAHMPLYQSVTVRNYRLIDIVDACCDRVSQNKRRVTYLPLFDVERM
jgi:hypothetical protein